MLDADGSMRVPHVNSRPNLSFHQVDVFSSECTRLIERETRGGSCVLTGVHLCGSLSPRLIDLGTSLQRCKGFVLCPCCLKGKLGSDCNGKGKVLGGQRSNYNVLVETMRVEAAKKGGDGRAEVEVRFDLNVMGPKNGFISAKRI